MALVGRLGVDQALTFLKADPINLRRRVRMVNLAREVCDGSIVGSCIAMLRPHSSPTATTSATGWR